MAAEYLLELYYPVGVLLEFKPESCEERTGGVNRRSVGKCGDLDLYAGGTNYIWNSDISGKCHASAGVVEAVACKFTLDGIAGAAVAFTEGVAALNHKAGNNSVES